MKKEIPVLCSSCHVAVHPRITHFPLCAPLDLIQEMLLCEVVLSCSETGLHVVVQQYLNPKQNDFVAMEIFQLMFTVGTHKQNLGQN